MWTALYWKRLAERTIKAAAGGYLSAWTVLGADFDSLISVEPLKGSAVAVVFSVLVSLTGGTVGDHENPSLVD